MKNLVLISFSILFLGGCASQRGPMAMAAMQPISGSAVQGVVHFQEMTNGEVEVRADLTGVPAGTHGFHVHEFGDCGDNGNAAGGHFNPMSAPHAGPDSASHHAGDFGNVTADASGNVKVRFTTRSVKVTAGSTSSVGHAVILHANSDDLTTQPTGNAGGRIACGVVTLSQMP